VDRIISDIAVFDVVRDADGGRQLTLTRLAPGVTLEDIRAKTEAEFTVALEDSGVETVEFEGAPA
jgi:3-oxoacid CoA-transferase subunit B